MNYLIYARVSPKGSSWTATETTISTQINECKAFVLRDDPEANFTIISDEFFSGKDNKRPGLQQTLAELKHNTAEWDCIVTYSLDRLTRSIVDALPIFEALQKAGKGYISVKQKIDMFSAGGRAMLYMMCVFAQLEREMTAERITTKMDEMSMQGLHVYGRAPFGYTKNKEKRILEVNEKEAKIVRSIFNDYITENIGLRIIARRYNMNYANVCKMIKNRTYLGKIVWKENEAEGKHPAIISVKTFETAKKKLPADNRSERPTARKYNYLLSGLIYCACGRHLTPYSILKTTKKGKVNYFYYKCTDQNCKNAINAERLDQRVIEELKSVKLNPQQITIILDELTQIQKEQLNKNEPQLQEINKDIQDNTAKQQRITDAVISGLITTANAGHFNQELEKINATIHELETRKAEIEESSIKSIPTTADIMNRLDLFNREFQNNKSPEVIRAFIQSRVEKLIVDKAKSVTLNLVMTNEQKWWSIGDSNS